MAIQAKRHRIIDRETGTLLSRDEFLSFDEASALHRELDEQGVSHSWEATDDGRAGWCGVARTFGSAVSA